jgi:hypothetical protein
MSVRNLFWVLILVLVALTFAPYLMAALGAILVACMLVASFFIVPIFFISVMLSGKDCKE